MDLGTVPIGELRHVSYGGDHDVGGFDLRLRIRAVCPAIYAGDALGDVDDLRGNVDQSNTSRILPAMMSLKIWRFS